MTDTQPGSESNDAHWNRQASTIDWEGWIAEENAADAERAKAKAADQAARAEAAAHQPVPHFPPPTGAPQPYPAGGWSAGPGPMPPMGYPQYQPVPTSRPRDVVSILALIFGILPTVPVGFVLGIVGIVRTRTPLRKGRWMAVTGLVLSILWVAGIVAGIAVLGSHLAQRDSSGAVVKKGLWPATDLHVGDCYHDDQNIGANHHFLTVMPCSVPHNAQVYASVRMTGSHDATLPGRALQSCEVKARTYFTGSTAQRVVRPGEFYPDPSAWSRGNHTVMCTAIDPSKDFVGDVKDDR